MSETRDDLNSLEAYDYSLPRDLVAQQPTDQRIDARRIRPPRRPARRARETTITATTAEES